LDPKAPPGASFVVRGGSFLDLAPHLSATYRTAAVPAMAHVTIGFRCVMDGPPDVPPPASSTSSTPPKP
jgi:formylglycine-generating enzyme required for sulfatase activity